MQRQRMLSAVDDAIQALGVEIALIAAEQRSRSAIPHRRKKRSSIEAQPFVAAVPLITKLNALEDQGRS
jgi:hypothetical protein